METAKKIVKAGYILLIMAVCTVPFLGMLLGWGSESTENRTAAGLPELYTVTENTREWNTAYTTELGDYYSENFGFRQELVTAYSWLNEKLFFRSANPKVTVGNDGWYYFNETIDDYAGISALSDRGIYRLKKTLDLMNRYASDNNITMLFFSAPNKNSIYPEYMPRYIQHSNQPSNLDRLSEVLSDSDYYVNIKKVLQDSAKDKSRSIYLKNDSHWNNIGALAAYNAMQDNLNSRISHYDYCPIDESGLTITETDTSGDLTRMLYPSFDQKSLQYDLGLEKAFSSDKPLTDLMAQEINTTCQGRYYNAICYRDSFFNALIPIQSNAFAKVRYTRQNPYDLTAAKSGNFHIAVVEIVERNLPDLLKNAPIMDALQTQAPQITRQRYAQQDCHFVDEGNALVFSGAIGDWVELKDDSNIYIELRSAGGQSFFYEAFPILTDDAYGDNGFSLRINKYTLHNDEYEAYLHVGNEELTRYAELQLD